MNLMYKMNEFPNKRDLITKYVFCCFLFSTKSHPQKCLKYLKNMLELKLNDLIRDKN